MGTWAEQRSFLPSDEEERLFHTEGKGALDISLDNFATKPVTTPLPATEACQYGGLERRFENAFYLGRNHHLYLNWTGSDTQSGIYDYEVGMATAADNSVSPDISGYTSTNHHSFYSVYHPALTEDSPFYILIRATNKAGVSSVTTLGPVILTRRPPTYSGTVDLTLSANHLMVTWDNSQFTEVEPQHLTFSVALEEQTGGASLRPHAPPQFSPPCSSTTPPSCATFDLSDLHWGLHETHTYVALVKVTNIVGLELELTSDPYIHDTRLAASGTVYDVVPADDVEALAVQRSEDTDFQLSRAAYEARWSGFEDGSQGVTYRVGVGTAPSSDDVMTFLPVGTATTHKFINLDLQLNTKYFFTVVAVTSGGEVTVSSDGMTVIQAGQAVEGVVVLDGPMPDLPCSARKGYQLSQGTLVARWSLTTEQRMRYPEVQWKVQKAIPGIDVWLDVTSYEASPRSDVVMATGLALQPGNRYRFAVKLCVGVTCSLAIFSDGVTVLSSPPIAGEIAVVYNGDTGGEPLLEVTFETFKDPDVTDLTSSQRVMYSYEWTLTDRSQGQRLLQPWQTVPTVETVNNTHSRFTVSVPSALSFHECLGVSLRGMNKAGLVSEVTADVMDCQAVDPALIVPRQVLDAVGNTVSGSSGEPVTLAFNDGWSQGDRDYTPHNDVISAVWPTLRHPKVKWAVMVSQGPDVTSHFENSGPQPLSDPCSSPNVIVCGEVEGQKYINVNFGPSSSRPLLENGRHYYVCISADAETVTFEKWTDDLPAVSACSDGVTVDLTSPVAGSVEVEGLRNGVYQTSLTIVSARWSGFSDIEEVRSTAHHSGILSYKVAVGSVPAGEDVLKNGDVGLTNHVTLHGLRLQDGHTYYVTIQAEDHVGRTISAISNGFVADSSAPQRTTAQFRFAQPYITSDNSVSLCWEDMFVDAESGIDSYIVSMGSRPGHDDVMIGQTVTAECGEFTTDVTLVNGHAYYVTVKAVNGAGLQSRATSPAITVMTTSPTVGHVFDGQPPSGSSPPRDVDFVTSVSEVAAFWSGFSTPLAPVTSYSIRLGRCAGCGDVISDFDIGLTEEVNWSHAGLHEGIRYFTTVTACNDVDQCTEVTSDGVMIDVTAPVKGTVWDGTGDVDIAFQAQRDYVGAQWRGFNDLGSGLAGFAWRAGTSPGGSDVMTSRDVGLAVSAFTKDLTSPLPVGQTVYVTVTATDRAGNSAEVTSNGFRVDASLPQVVRAPALSRGLGTLDNLTLVSRDALSVSWEIQDSDSQVETQFVSLTSHQLGEFESRPTQVPGPLKEYAFTTLSLHDGSRYSVKVTGCNLARLCTSTSLTDILHDSTPPTTGMFAVDTDHAADLRRHIDGWMSWSSNSLKLAWLGFHDLHSGIDHYEIRVGTTPFATDLLPGDTFTTVSHSESGTSFEDEGFVQMYHVTTETLSYGDSIYIAVWAVNGVGLRSHPALSRFDLEEGGGMSLRRRCSSYSCLAQCVCAVQGGTCASPTPCTVYSADSTPNAILTVHDRADLSVLETTSLSRDTHEASTVYLAATWEVSVNQGLAPSSNSDIPSGVFSSVDDRMWKDVGTSLYSVIVIPPDRSLNPKLSYSTFVRCWYPDGSYTVFKSPGIIPLVKAPGTTNQVGRAVKEHAASNQEKDVDFVTSSDTVHITWKGKFISTSSPIQTINVYIGTTPEAHYVHSSGVLSPSAESYQTSGLQLAEDTLYYTTVVAWGEGGMVSWAVSDGFMLDTTSPGAGVVVDGTGLEDANYQSRDDRVSARWHGFSDVGSGVRRYMWCVGLTPDKADCDVMDWTDVGLMTSGNMDLSSPVSQGSTLYSKVYAEDAAGHRSEVSVSNGVKVDTTPPVARDLVYSGGVNLLSNPSFEADTAQDTNQGACDLQPPTSWQGQQHVLLSGGLTQTVSGLTPGAVYRFTVRLAYPATLMAHHRPLSGHVTLGRERHAFELDPRMCRGVCDAVEEPVIMWHQFSYIVSAPASSLDVSISTTVASGEQQLAVDHAELLHVQYVQEPGALNTNALSTGAVFLPQWSVVQASWHFTDAESTIVDYQWALGTVQGGVQIQGFHSVGRRQHATVSGLKLTHGLPLYVTVLARNAAGLTSVAYSEPLVTDMTPPVISDLVDGSGTDVDFQTGNVISATWTASDSESGVANCQWAIGFTPGRGDILAFENVPTPASDTFTASADVAPTLASLTLPQTVYVSVRCYNRAGLPAHDVTDGVTIVAIDNDQSLGSLQLLADGVTHYPAQETCHVLQDRLRLRWSNLGSTIPTSGFQVGYSANGIAATDNTPSLPYLLESARIQDINFARDTLYDVTLTTIDIRDVLGSKVNKTTHLKPDAPSVKAGGSVTSSISGTDLTLSWPDLFVSDLDLVYEVTVGSVVGGSDMFLWRQTSATSVVVSLENAKATSFTLSVVVTAVDPCGQFVSHVESVDVNL
ncbi:hypothetical protein BaRGS_00008092 [Batillaria attramentaria]|uniref:Fibronectin type-III domain-containing protein n=1 Tax=Batillaria attramentaria TaxID=370345 RepID=A0ABD0LN91_9CAEN